MCVLEYVGTDLNDSRGFKTISIILRQYLLFNYLVKFKDNKYYNSLFIIDNHHQTSEIFF